MRSKRGQTILSPLVSHGLRLPVWEWTELSVPFCFLLKQLIDRPGAVAVMLDGSIVSRGHRPPQISDRRPLGKLDMPMPFEASADRGNGQRIGRMAVRISHSRAVEDERLVEQRSRAVLSLAQSLQEFRE